LVTGRFSDNALYKELSARKTEWGKEGIQGICQAGDCYAPRFLSDAIFAGHRIGREMGSANLQCALPYRRERLVWGAAVSER